MSPHYIPFTVGVKCRFAFSVPLNKGCNYASPSSGDANNDRQLTLNFEL